MALGDVRPTLPVWHKVKKMEMRIEVADFNPKLHEVRGEASVAVGPQRPPEAVAEPATKVESWDGTSGNSEPIGPPNIPEQPPPYVPQAPGAVDPIVAKAETRQAALGRMKLAELRGLCTDYGLTAGPKLVMIDRIMAYEFQG